jgi:HK97 gp10 family phage protein
MKANYSIQGIEELTEKAEKIADAVSHKNMGEGLLKRAEAVRDRLKQRAPLGPTGNLRRSPMAKLMQEKSNMPAIAIAGIDRKIAPHAHLVEFGTSHSAPNPFFRPTIDEMKSGILKNIGEDAKSRIEKAV